MNSDKPQIKYERIEGSDNDVRAVVYRDGERYSTIIRGFSARKIARIKRIQQELRKRQSDLQPV